jgi:hypothetical protein
VGEGRHLGTSYWRVMGEKAMMLCFPCAGGEQRDGRAGNGGSGDDACLDGRKEKISPGGPGSGGTTWPNGSTALLGWRNKVRRERWLGCIRGLGRKQ